MVPPATSFWMLGLYTSFTHVIDSCISIVRRTYEVCYDLWFPAGYVFFSGNETPYQTRLINTGAVGSAIPEWIYTPEQHQFIEWPHMVSADLTLSHQLPILSMEIVDGDKVLYDLTDFIERVKVYNDNIISRSPCVAHIIAAWGLSSGIVLDASLGFDARLINTAAETHTVSVYDTDLFDIQPLESDDVTKCMEDIVKSVLKED